MNPSCPKCGKSMMRRLARRGPNAGNYFWGCSGYPDCRGIRNIDNNEILDEVKLNPIQSEENVSFDSDEISCGENAEICVSYEAKPYAGFDEMTSFQSTGCSRSIMEKINNDETFASAMLDTSKFRVDYTRAAFNELTEQQREICALLLRTLCRGRVTYISPYVESKVAELFDAGEILSVTHVQRSLMVFSKDTPYCYDSEREMVFASEVLKPVLGAGWQYCIDTQVFIDSISGDDCQEKAQRIDFLVSDDSGKYVIEIDGSEHILHAQKDRNRDLVLENAGYKVIRIDNLQVDSNLKSLRQDMARKLSSYTYSGAISENDDETIRIAIFRLIHQVQIAIVSGILRGAVDPADMLSLNIDSKVLSDTKFNSIGKLIMDDLKQQFDSMCELYEVPVFFNCKYDPSAMNCISYQVGNTAGKLTKALISSVNSMGAITVDIPYYNHLELTYYDESLLLYYLNYFFRHEQFREGQLDGVTRLLSGQDSIILLPTGSGKSVIYQLAAMLQPGKTIIVSPLISLMQDQIENLQWSGIECAVAVSSQNRDIDNAINDPANVMVYISPERLQLKSFRDGISSMQVNNSVCTVAIDEAHCVSEWGHDFRTAYLNIGRTSRNLFNFYGRTPTIIALTGTASTAVLKDVKRELEIMDYDAVITPESFDRPELNFKVVSSSSDNKKRMLQALLDGSIPQFFNNCKTQFYQLNGTGTNGGIIFCPHINGDFGISSVVNTVNRQKISTDIYSGRAPKSYCGNWDKEKREIARNFKLNKINTLVATKAFGMGIDKPNVAFTIHYGIPGSIESFYQEAGRAARGKDMKALCSIVLSDENINEDNELLDPRTPLERIQKIISGKDISTQDDISRMMYFHINSFKGVDFEMKMVRHIIGQLCVDENTLTTSSVILTCDRIGDWTLNNVQKAVQRLLVLGIIRDYTIEYSANEILLVPGSDDVNEIRDNYAIYVKGYNEGRVGRELDKLGDATTFPSKQAYIYHASAILTEFIYDTIEKGRRRGLAEMRNAAEAALHSKEPDTTLRERVIRYFETTYAEQLFDVVEDGNLGFDIIPAIFDGEVVDDNGGITGGIRAANEAAGLRGGTSRFLESTPDHPGLLILRSLAELYCKDYNRDAIFNDIKSACYFATERYSQKREQLSYILKYYMIKILERDESLYEPSMNAISAYIDEIEVNAAILENRRLSERAKRLPAKRYFNYVGKRALSIIAERKGEQV